jgi:methanogenic corrinoid protein MtbC1
MSASMKESEGVPIASVEQATGIARATLRIWERRYGFPQPGRDLRGERSYPQEQVHKLRLIGQLMLRGQRPGRLVQLSAAQLAALAGPAATRPEGLLASVAGVPVDDPVLAPLRNHDPVALAALLEEGVRRLGLAGFIEQRIAEMNVHVGLAWARGEVEVYEEHLYAEAVQDLLRTRIAQIEPAGADAAPRVLLATLPEEPHGIGLLMAQALVALAGCPCTSLGTRVPVPQLVAAAGAFRADVVGLSFTGSMNPTHVLRGLEQLRGELAPHVAIWAGGSAPVLARHRIPGVRVVPHIREVHAALAEWRAARALRSAAG